MELKNYESSEAISMKDNVYKILKNNILELYLKPGEMLNKKEIAKELNVSRTPIREAFVKLKEDGLINVYPQSGTQVSYIDLQKVEEAQFMRQHLEKAVIILANEIMSQEGILRLETNVALQKVSQNQLNVKLENSRRKLKDLNYIKLFELDNEFHKIIFEECNKINVWNAIQKVGIDLNRIRVLSLAADFNRNEIIEEHNQILEAIKTYNIKKAEKFVEKHTKRIEFDKDKLKNSYSSYFKKV